MPDLESTWNQERVSSTGCGAVPAAPLVTQMRNGIPTLSIKRGIGPQMTQPTQGPMHPQNSTVTFQYGRTDRGLRHHQRPGNGRAYRSGRVDRLVVHAPIRFSGL